MKLKELSTADAGTGIKLGIDGGALARLPSPTAAAYSVIHLAAVGEAVDQATRLRAESLYRYRHPRVSVQAEPWHRRRRQPQAHRVRFELQTVIQPGKRKNPCSSQSH